MTSLEECILDNECRREENKSSSSVCNRNIVAAREHEDPSNVLGELTPPMTSPAHSPPTAAAIVGSKPISVPQSSSYRSHHYQDLSSRKYDIQNMSIFVEYIKQKYIMYITDSNIYTNIIKINN